MESCETCKADFMATDMSTAANPNASSTQDDQDIRLMITGDSMTQGSEGDHTWRYRLWQWMHSTPGVKARFVGPYAGAQEQGKARGPQPPALLGEAQVPDPPRIYGKYAKDVAPDWASDSYHFATWGRQAAQTVDWIFEQVRDYQPHYLLVALGFNDIGWKWSDGAGTVGSVSRLVAQARLAKPDINLILSTIPHRSFMLDREDLVLETDKFNELVRVAISEMDSPTSRICLAELQSHYACSRDACPAGYDGLHPNALGEYQFAKAFSEAIQNLGIRGRDCPLIVPYGEIEEPPMETITEIVAEGAPMGVKVVWKSAFGARHYEIRSRVRGSGQQWSESISDAPRYDTTLTETGTEWEYMVRGVRGEGERYNGAWSNVVSAVARRETPPGPKDIRVTSVPNGFHFSWTAPSKCDVDRYEIITLDNDIPGAFTGAWCVRNTSAELLDFIANHRYQLWVATWSIVDGEYARGLPVFAGTHTCLSMP